MGPYAVLPLAGQPNAYQQYPQYGMQMNPYGPAPYGGGGGGIGAGGLIGILGPVVTWALAPAALPATAVLADTITFNNSLRQAVITGSIVQGVASLVGF